MKKIVALVFLLAIGAAVALYGEKIFNGAIRGYLSLRGIEARTLERGGARVFYFEGGKEHDQTVILLHGVGGYSLSSWFRLMPELVKTHHVIAPDLFFANLPDMVDSGYSIRLEEQLVDMLYDEARLSSASLVGLSFGAWPALRMAMDSPERVDRLVLISPLDGSANETVGALELAPEAPGRDFYYRIFHSPPPVPSLFLKPHWERTAKVFEALPAFRQQLEREGQYLNANLHKVACPVLVLYGKDDRIISQDRFQNLADGVQHGRSVGFEECGHAVVWDQSTRMVDEVVNFLGQGGR